MAKSQTMKARAKRSPSSPSSTSSSSSSSPDPSPSPSPLHSQPTKAKRSCGEKGPGLEEMMDTLTKNSAFYLGDNSTKALGIMAMLEKAQDHS